MEAEDIPTAREDLAIADLQAVQAAADRQVEVEMVQAALAISQGSHGKGIKRMKEILTTMEIRERAVHGIRFSNR